MKTFIFTTAAAVFLVGCGDSQQSSIVEAAEEVEVIAEPTTPKLIAAEQVLPPPVEVETPVEVAEPEVALEIQEANRALKAAAAEGDLEGIREQLAAGADLNARNSSGKTLYEVGVRDEKTASFLRKNGAKTSRELDAEGL